MAAKLPNILTANICGGLGNQLFQVANLVATAARYDLPMGMERLAMSDSIDEPRPTYWGSAFSRFCEVCPPLPPSSGASGGPSTDAYLPLPPTVTVVREHWPLGSQVPILPPSASTDGNTLYQLVGFYQSHSYFSDYEGLVNDVLIDPSLLRVGAGAVRRGYGRMHHSDAPLGDDRNHYIAMHVRRGDYLRYSDTFVNLPLGYYEASLRQLLGRQLVGSGVRLWGGWGANAVTKGGLDADSQGSVVAGSPSDNDRRADTPLKVLLFTDDTSYGHMIGAQLMGKYTRLDVMVVSEECEGTMGIPTSFTSTPMISDEDGPAAPSSLTTAAAAPAPLPRDVLELYMMAACDDVIMANSSFSWWGAHFMEARCMAEEEVGEVGGEGMDGGNGPLCRVIAPMNWFVKDPFPQSSHLYKRGWAVVQ